MGGSGHLRVLGCGVLSSFIITTFTLPFGHSLSSSYAKSVIFVHFLFTFLNQWAPTFLAPGSSFVEDNLPQTGSGDGFWDDSVHYIYCALYFYYYYYISSTSDHQTLDPGGWGPLF